MKVWRESMVDDDEADAFFTELREFLLFMMRELQRPNRDVGNN